MTTTAAPPEGVTLKGTRHGLLICIREDLEFESVLQQITEKLEQNSGFLGGAQISLDLGWRELSQQAFERLIEALGKVELVGVLSTSLQTRTVAESLGIKAIIGRLGLAHHQGRRLRQEQREKAEAEASMAPPPVEPAQAQTVAEAAPDTEQEQEATLYIKRTLRSGQKAVYPGNIVLWGDLNPGAELEADGDVLVLGTVRGRIHAGCNGNEEAQIYCQALHPTVVRIADGIWTGDIKEAGVQKLPASVRVSCAKDQLRFETTR
jgi:septum site-determining protein MinC